jgi:hypothetical protein
MGVLYLYLHRNGISLVFDGFLLPKQTPLS